MARYYLDFEKPVAEIEKRIQELKKYSYHPEPKILEEINLLENRLQKARLKVYGHLTRWQKTQLSRHFNRPTTMDFIEKLFTDFVELHGDRKFADDPAIIGGIARFKGEPVAVVGHQKGRTIQDKVARNFGMPNPEGYRKALRLMELAERFEKPLITMIDTPGAYPGQGAEERGQSAAIAENLQAMAVLKIPIVAVVIGEGGSGGALALAVGDRILMFEHATYSVISPEGCAAILWKSEDEKERAAEALKGTASDLLEMGVIDEVIPEPLGGAHQDLEEMTRTFAEALSKNLNALKKISMPDLLQKRYEKFRKMGKIRER